MFRLSQKGFAFKINYFLFVLLDKVSFVWEQWELFSFPCKFIWATVTEGGEVADVEDRNIKPELINYFIFSRQSRSVTALYARGFFWPRAPHRQRTLMYVRARWDNLIKTFSPSQLLARATAKATEQEGWGLESQLRWYVGYTQQAETLGYSRHFLGSLGVHSYYLAKITEKSKYS